MNKRQGNNRKVTAALILAAGKGVRMNSDLPKVLHPVSCKPLLGHILEAVEGISARSIFVIVGHGEKEVRQYIGSRAQGIRQMPQLGTGHAVLCAKPKLKSWKNDLLILPGDAPFVEPAMLRELVARHQKSDAGATVLTAQVSDPKGYGRILKEHGSIYAIREELDASESERAITEVNTGVYVFDTVRLFEHLGRLKADNQKKEYYLTDVIDSFVSSGIEVQSFEIKLSGDALGVNSRIDLAKMEKAINQREIEKHQRNGVTVVSPENTWIASGAKIGKDTTIFPFCWIEDGVVIGEKCQIGPAATIRKNTKIESGVVIGNFVEVTRSKIGKKTRIKHLSYIGDAQIGNDVNIGAGTITANFDGKNKNKTVIQNGASVGSGTTLVAPVKLAKKSKTGAGSVLLKGTSVKSGETFVGIPARKVTRKK